MSVPMKPGECRRTRAGVLYCYIPELGTRFCPVGTTTAEECKARLRITGDRRRGRWERRRIGVELPTYIPPRPLVAPRPRRRPRREWVEYWKPPEVL